LTSPHQFQSVTASVFPSQATEIVIGKQPALADYGREVRSAINQFPPDVSRNLIAEYREPSPQLVARLEEAITSRELAIENVAQEANLDQQWLQSANAQHTDNLDLGADDGWNSPAP